MDRPPDDKPIEAPRAEAQGSPIVLVALVVAGFVVRVLVAWFSIGSSDADTWPKFGAAIRDYGLFYVYEHSGNLNHPPLLPLWWVAVFRLSDLTGLSYEFVYKIPMMLADVGSCMILGLIWSRRRDTRMGWLAAAAFACSPVAILVSAYHCNSDSIYAFFCLAAANFAFERKMLWSGLSLGAAINIKLVPVLLIPPLLSLCRNWRQAARLVLGLAIAALPFVPVLVQAGPAFVNSVLGYNPQPDRWGIGEMLYEFHQFERFQQMSLQALQAYFWLGRYLILAAVGAITLVSLIWRRWDAFELNALVLAIFLLLTSGFGVQYAIIILPLMLAVSIRWGWVYGVISGLFLLSAYWINWTGTVPFYSRFNGPLPTLAAVAGALTWLYLVAFATRTLRRPREAVPPAS